MRLPHSTRDEAAIAAETPVDAPAVSWLETRGTHAVTRFDAWRTSSTATPSGSSGTRCSASPGAPRPAYAGLFASLQPIDGEELAARADLLSQTYRDAGVTFAHAGEEQPFPLDIVPRVIGAEEWDVIERGVAQRVHALEAFLADVYGAGQCFADRIVPRSVVTTSAHFHRQAHGLVPPNGVRVHVSGIDLVRDEAGDFRVLEDNLRSPSGVSYVITNRAAMSQVLPELFADHRIQPVADYPSKLLAALKASAPSNVADPTVVVLTPGVYNSAYFEHALLARQMGVELVEGRDLVCAGNQVSMRTTDGQQRVDVIYRRIDDEFLDPVHFRPDSVIGCAGVLNAARAGRVDHRQRGRQRRRRRQAALHLGARPDPLLPGRGAGAGQRRDLPARRPRTPSSGCWRRSTSWCSSRSTAPAARASSSGRGPTRGRWPSSPVKVRARAAGLDRAEADRPVHLPHADRRPDRAAARRPAAVRGQRRRQGVGAARRADPRRAARGRAGGQLQPGRRPPPAGYGTIRWIGLFG